MVPTSRFVSRTLLPVLIAVYLPFLAMAIAMTLLSSCGHCIKTAWLVLPAGPGLVFYELIASALRFPGTTIRRMCGGIAFSILIVLLGTVAVNRLGTGRLPALACTLVFFALLAWGTAQMILW